MMGAAGGVKQPKKPSIQSPKKPFDPVKARHVIFREAALARGHALVAKKPMIDQQPHLLYGITYDVEKDKEGKSVQGKGNPVSSQFDQFKQNLKALHDANDAAPEVKAFVTAYQPKLDKIADLMKERAMGFLQSNQQRVAEIDAELKPLFEEAKAVKEAAEKKDVKVKEAIAKDEELKKLDNLQKEIETIQLSSLQRFAQAQRDLNFQKAYAADERAERASLWLRAGGSPEDAKTAASYIAAGRGEIPGRTIVPGWYTNNNDPNKENGINISKDKEGRLWASIHPPVRPNNKEDFKRGYRAAYELLDPLGRGKPIIMKGDPNAFENFQKAADDSLVYSIFGPSPSETISNWVKWNLELAKEMGGRETPPDVLAKLGGKLKTNPGVELHVGEEYWQFLYKNLKGSGVEGITRLKTAIEEHNKEVRQYQQAVKEAAKDAAAKAVGKEDAGRAYLKDLEDKGRGVEVKGQPTKTKQQCIDAALNTEVKETKAKIDEKVAKLKTLAVDIINAKTPEELKAAGVKASELSEAVQPLQSEYEKHKDMLAEAQIGHDGMDALAVDLVAIGPEKMKELQSSVKERGEVIKGVQQLESESKEAGVSLSSYVREKVNKARDDMMQDAAFKKLVSNIENMSSDPKRIDDQVANLKKEAAAVANRLKDNFEKPEAVLERKIWDEAIAKMEADVVEKEKGGAAEKADAIKEMQKIGGLKNEVQRLNPRNVQDELELKIENKQNQLENAGGPAPRR